jgi:hypothetical protein
MQASPQVVMFSDDVFNKERLPGSAKAASILFTTLGQLWHEGDNNNEAIVGFRADRLIRELNDFETLLELEVKNLNTFVLEDVGIFSINKRVDSADLHLAESTQSTIDERVKTDFRAAGRCLAFDLFTASGFHSVRAIEAVARSYYKQFTGKDADIGSCGTPLGGIIKAFRTERDARNLPKDGPLDLIIANLALANNIYRKPIGHPQMILETRDDAKKVFDLATILINMLAEQIAAQDNGS